MNNNFILFRNRLLNGKPFTRDRATERINTMLRNLEITEEEGRELISIVEERGVYVLPEDTDGRFEKVETEIEKLKSSEEELTLMMADLIGGAV